MNFITEISLVSMQKQMWTAVTSHTGHMAEIRLQDLNNVFVDMQLF